MSRFTRQEIWKHNSYSGHVAMARRNMRAIQVGATATLPAKELAHQIELSLDKLSLLLKERDE